MNTFEASLRGGQANTSKHREESLAHSGLIVNYVCLHKHVVSRETFLQARLIINI